MPDVVAFSCCSGGPMASVGAVHFLSVSCPLPTGLGAKVGSELAMSPRDRTEALHEACHAACAIAVGDRVLHAEIEPGLFVRRGGQVSPASATIIALAADAGTAWHAGSRIARMADADAVAYLGAVRAGCGGPCDNCRAIRSLTGSGDYTDAEILIAFRQLETMAGVIVRHPAVWAAIDEIADQLMTHGSLIGEVVHTIADRHFAAGFISLECQE